MIPMSLKYIAAEINGSLVCDGSKVTEDIDVTIDYIFTDSRINEEVLNERKGLFLAIKGPYFDAHEFADEILNKGAVAIVVEKQLAVNAPQIIVSNTRLALAEIARLNRQKSKAKYVAITGSCGKTTVKEMTASILALTGKTFATKGNLNNEIGVPLTLLSIDESIEYAVIELGANHSGEIAFTSDIVKPHVAVVNNVSEAHLQGFGTLQRVASAKAEIYASLNLDGIAVVNSDDDFANYFIRNINNKTIKFMSNNITIDETQDNNIFENFVRAVNIKICADQSTTFSLLHDNQLVEIKLPLVGEHNVENALAAASCCIALNVPLETIALGLASTPVVNGRLVVKPLANGCRVIDDTYNANLASMKAAIDLLRNYQEPKIFVIGDMAELGQDGRECHEKVGIYAAKAGINKIFSCGVLSQFTQRAFLEMKPNQNAEADCSHLQAINHFSQQSELIIKLKNEAKAGSTILVKGSRSAKMEVVVQALIDSAENNTVELEASIASLQGVH